MQITAEIRRDKHASLFLNHSAPDDVKAAIARLGRTEDVMFSPDNKRLALVALFGNKILVLSISTDLNAQPPQISLTKAVEIDCADFKYPHGLDWIDNDHLIVSNRQGDLCVFKVPETDAVFENNQITPVRLMRAGGDWILNTPGSVASYHLGEGFYEILVCNNYVHYISRHILDANRDFLPVKEEVLIRGDLNIPDGVTYSKSGRWAAVSNHERNRVNVYDLEDPDFSEQTAPKFVLADLSYPHGVRFSPDESLVYVSDAGAPFANVYRGPNASNSQTLQPLHRIEVVDAESFVAGNVNPTDGGAKGLDVSQDGHLMVATCQYVPLAFVDMRPILEQTQCAKGNKPPQERRPLDAKHFEFLVALSASRQQHLDEVAARKVELEHIFSSRSWRISAPVRWLGTLFGR